MIVCSINLKLCNTIILVASIHWFKKIITIVYVRQRGITLVIQCTTQPMKSIFIIHTENLHLPRNFYNSNAFKCNIYIIEHFIILEVQFCLYGKIHFPQFLDKMNNMFIDIISYC